MKRLRFLTVGLLACCGLMTPWNRAYADYDKMGDPDYRDNAFFPAGVDEEFQIAWSHIPFKMFGQHFFSNFLLDISDEAWDCDDCQTGLLIQRLYTGDYTVAKHPLNEWGYRGQGKWDGRYWYRYWDMIAVINANLEEFPGKEISDDVRTRYIAEAKVLRAFYYLQLVKHYGRLPIVTDPKGLYSATADLSLRPAYEVCRYIVDECREAIRMDCLPWRLSEESEFNRMTSAIACAVMSQASLFGSSPLYADGQNLWQWAYEVNKEAFDLLIAHDYELYNTLQTPWTYGVRGHGYLNPYHEYFAMESVPGKHPEDKETIWAATCKAGVQQAVINQMPLFADGHYKAGLVPTQELVDAYNMVATGEPIYDLANPYVDEKHSDININPKSGYDPNDPYTGRDPRFYATIYYNLSETNNGVYKKVVYTYNNTMNWKGEKLSGVSGNCYIDRRSRMNSRTGYYLRKYMGDQATYKNKKEEGNWKYFRLGEVYLNYAEAAIEAGHLPEGLKLINDIRHRAGFDPAVDKQTSDQAQARLWVRNERQVELALEECRYFDVRRWKKLGEEIAEEKYKTGMWIMYKGDTKPGNPKPSDFEYNRFVLAVNDDATQSGAGGDSPSQPTFEAKNVLLPVPIPEVKRLSELTGKPAEYWQNPLYFKESDYTGIDAVMGDADETIRVYVNAGQVTVMTGVEFVVYTADGRKVTGGRGVSTFDNVAPGLYIVTDGRVSVKFVVR